MNQGYSLTNIKTGTKLRRNYKIPICLQSNQERNSDRALVDINKFNTLTNQIFVGATLIKRSRERNNFGTKGQNIPHLKELKPETKK